MSKICGECANFDRSLSKCNKIQDDSIRENDTVICCPFYELKPPTLFDRITASPEVLAEKLVYSIKIISGCEIMYSSNVLDVCYNTKEKAIRATVARLKEVEK
jgi:hypothetical protein